MLKYIYEVLEESNVGRMDPRLNSEPLEVVDCLVCSCGCKLERMSEARGILYIELIKGMKRGSAIKLLTNKGLGINAKKRLYEGAFVPTALYEAGAQGMRNVERIIILEV